jgi:hypothetical protein
MQEGIFYKLTDWTIFMNKLLTALTIAAFATTGAFAQAKKEEKAAAPAAAASKADAKAADKKAAAPAAAASAKK